MSRLPPEVSTQLEARLGSAHRGAAAIGGGMINQAARVEIGGEVLFVKWRSDAPPSFFEAEADGLSRLAEAGALRVPEPIMWADAPAAPVPFLAMEYINVRQPDNPRAFAQRFGEGLALLHRSTARVGGTFGLERDNFIGILPQANKPMLSWPKFYRDRRLLPQIEIAHRARRLPPHRERALMTLCERIGDLLPDATPCLVHGDLWSGNFLPVGDDAALVDPAAYRADREVEMAYVELFGGFPPGMLEAYRGAYPLEAGYEDRRLLLQLLPLLVHLNHFGEQYGPDVDRACEPYLA